MIASENYTSHFVLKPVGSVLTFQYPEGYPQEGIRRLRVVDELEVSPTVQLFGAEHANANPVRFDGLLAVYSPGAPTGDCLMGMDLNSGEAF